MLIPNGGLYVWQAIRSEKKSLEFMVPMGAIGAAVCMTPTSMSAYAWARSAPGWPEPCSPVGLWAFSFRRVPALHGTRRGQAEPFSS